MLFFFQAEDGIRDIGVTGVQTCALPISNGAGTSFTEADGPVRDGKPVLDPQDVLIAFSDGDDDDDNGYPDDIDRKSVVQGKSVDLGGRRIIKKKNGGGQYM